ncbi:MAG: glycosyltransferase [Bradyrhizobium sp.]|uniref:glycosyltransferase n=1 Tax=Bradyrhizobium sp. TaxID=376 RepID=UPI001C2A1994|nr:glycosyltransferase [Bradyrhizobium sp.]MBU6461131.1 glycosyltransferase [Pseudomonadota bacterium]MDE2066208.1 glycosyltransferase [Bradyrhizobium sp.]MDE2472648.1 glycosyltransferase [Bradyrhizobium sp.]
MSKTDFDVAYIVSQYPKVSHSFIRREILELERRGLQIFRVSIRGWDIPLVDPIDIAELEKTTFVLKVGALQVLLACFTEVINFPIRFCSAALLALQMMRGSDRLAIWHLFYLAEACWIAPQIRQRKITHLHAHFGTNPTEVAALTAILADVTFSFTVHGPEEFDKVHSIHLAKMVKRATFTVAISSYCRSQIYRVTDYQLWDKIKIIHCGIDPEFAEVDAMEPPENNKLVCIGRLSEQKGQLLLVEAMADLFKERQDFELVLVGDGEFRAPIEKLIARHGLSKQIRIIGWATAAQVKREILSARAVILPSFAEGLPVVLMEAMTLGRPVLSTFVAGIPELVVDGKTGWLFPAGSKRDMLDAIRKCLVAPASVLQEMGRCGRARALKRHNLFRQADLLLELFGWRAGGPATTSLLETSSAIQGRNV